MTSNQQREEKDGLLDVTNKRVLDVVETLQLQVNLEDAR
jgi:hypothetical protein